MSLSMPPSTPHIRSLTLRTPPPNPHPHPHRLVQAPRTFLGEFLELMPCLMAHDVCIELFHAILDLPVYSDVGINLNSFLSFAHSLLPTPGPQCRCFVLIGVCLSVCADR